MKETINKLVALLKSGSEYILNTSESEISHKENPEKWSKKEIIGHLIDSAINNLQRFTEIQFEDKPYQIRSYNQDALVKANDYQNSNIKEILEFWLSINNRIIELIEKQTDETLIYKIKFDNGNIEDLRFLMNNYVEHLEHHLNQIKK